MKVDVMGVQIDNVSKAEAIAQIDTFVRSGLPHYVVTPYSEMILFAQKDPNYKKVLNLANLSLPDGIGILWAATYLHTNVALVRSLYSILRKPESIRTVIQEQVTGRQFVYDLAKLAADKNYSLALVGGSDIVAAQAGYELTRLYPNLKIRLAASGHAFDDDIIKEIANSNSDILLLAYSPPKQEAWIAENLSKLNVKVAMGLGGTFDYLSAKHPPAPDLMHQMGLEWLWRLASQPWRFGRIWNAVPVLIWKVYNYKKNFHEQRSTS